VIDQPGVIYSYSNRKLGNLHAKRNIYFFEKVIADIQLETINMLGKERTKDIWYRIGKDTGVRSILIANPKKLSDLFIPIAIEYLFSGYKVTGFTLSEHLEFNNRKKTLKLRGTDNLICRLSGEGSYFAGAISGILTELIGENIEAEKPFCCKHDKYCEITASPDIKEKYIPDKKELEPMRDYRVLNCKIMTHKIKGMCSHKDLIRFNKIKTDENGKTRFYNEVISFTEIGCLSLIWHNYKKINAESILKKAIVRSSKDIMIRIIGSQSSIDEKICFIQSMLSGFGWGMPLYRKEKNKVLFSFHYAPITRYGFEFEAYSLQGFLQSAFKDAKLKRIRISLDMPKIDVEYTIKE
jgi:hypothetical protein